LSVSTAAQLTDALNNAQPGDTIEVAPGTYIGRWTIVRSGAFCAPITLTGPRMAILRGPDLTGTELYLNGADYWVIHGISLQKSLTGIGVKNGANWNVVDSLDTSGQGQANVVIKTNSTHNKILHSQIHGGGISDAQFGEGVYIGTAESEWVNGVPDRSDSNEVIGNHIYGTTADGIQSMAGTTGTLIRGDTIDGSAMVAISSAPPHWVLAMGNDMVLDSNLATNALTQGMKVRRSSTAPTWGSNIVFSANQMTMSSRAQSYPAIYLETQPAQGMVVMCDNVRTDPGTLANLACTP
jgi:hypothetical protein